MKLAFITDFDGTVTEFDVTDFLLLSLDLVTREEIEHSYSLGINSEEWMKRYFIRIKNTDKSEIKKLIDEKVNIRRGFKELFNYFKSNNLPFEIVSGGADIYIDYILDKYGIKNVNLYCGKFLGDTVEYGFLNNMKLSDFKASRVRYYKDKGYKTVFCGDSPNDFKAAKIADILFATSRLENMCKENSVNYYPLEDFYGVMDVINASVH